MINTNQDKSYIVTTKSNMAKQSKIKRRLGLSPYIGLQIFISPIINS